MSSSSIITIVRPSCRPPPLTARMTTGTVNWLPNMARSLAEWLTIWSMTSMAKSMKRISTTGRQPTNAAPTAMPVKDARRVAAADALDGAAYATLGEAGRDAVFSLLQDGHYRLAVDDEGG